MIYYKNVREVGNCARAGAFSFTRLYTAMKGSRVAGISICPWHDFHVGKNSPLCSELTPRELVSTIAFSSFLNPLSRTFLLPRHERNVSADPRFYESLMRRDCISMQSRERYVIFFLMYKMGPSYC